MSGRRSAVQLSYRFDAQGLSGFVETMGSAADLEQQCLGQVPVSGKDHRPGCIMSAAVKVMKAPARSTTPIELGALQPCNL